MGLTLTEQLVTGEFIEVKSLFWHREGSDDYTNDSTNIIKIVDRDGQELMPIWQDNWHEVAPGIRTRHRSHTNYVRVLATACPVRILFHSVNEYVSYSDREFNSHSASDYWCRYVTSPHTSEPTSAAKRPLWRTLGLWLPRLFQRHP
jgi:hypothetical protein